MNFRVVTVLLAIVGLGVAQNAAASNLLINGDFETPVQGPPDFAAFNVGTQYPTTYITGWTVIQGNVDLTTTANYGPGPNTLHPSSVQDIDLIGNTQGSNGVFGGLSQSFATTAGQMYRLSFDYSHNPGHLSPSGSYAASVTLVDGNAPGNSIFSGSVSQPNGTATWVAFSQDFTAVSDLTLLSFIDTQGAQDAGIYLDEVSVEALVTATPIPAALPLVAGGLGALGLFGWRRKRKVQAAA